MCLNLTKLGGVSGNPFLILNTNSAVVDGDDDGDDDDDMSGGGASSAGSGRDSVTNGVPDLRGHNREGPPPHRGKRYPDDTIHQDHSEYSRATDELDLWTNV
ncbi:hypothetical protein PG994_013298 [Apiospora phragmitis]|uniref:Uncharacterized protein n=1 Tax=Apiospora phragmitis TaxID=2905665 RepID=A0ABR1TA01_9PEZI